LSSFFKSIKLILFISIFYYIFHEFDFYKLALIDVNYFYMILSIFIFILSLYLVSLRWKMMLPLLTFKSAFESTFVRASINNILPAKLGEVAKILYLKKVYKVNFSSTLPLLIIDRLMDILLMLIVFCLGFYVFSYKELDVSFLYMGITFFTIVGLTFYLFIKNSLSLLKIIRTRHRKATQFILNNIRILNNLSLIKLNVIFFITLFIWCCYIAFLYFSLCSVGIFFSFEETLLMFLIITVASVIPLLPSGIGITEAGFIFILTKYGYSKEFILVFAVYYHITRALIPTILGIYFAFSNGLKFKEFFEYKKN